MPRPYVDTLCFQRRRAIASQGVPASLTPNAAFSLFSPRTGERSESVAAGRGFPIQQGHPEMFDGLVANLGAKSFVVK